MLELIRSWIMGIAGAAVICAIASEITPSGAVKNVQKIICGIVMAIALIYPLLNFDFSAYSINVAKYRDEASEITQQGEEISNRYQRSIIEESSAAYILDKAESLSLDIAGATVSAAWSTDGVWYLESATIYGGYNAALSSYIESELGIEGGKQYWRDNENG